MAKEIKETKFELEVQSPEVARPKELPLVVKPAGGAEWKNPQQAKYAAILNAFAYRNPDKWAINKDDRTEAVIHNNVTTQVSVKGLLSKLLELGDNPGLYTAYTGEQFDAPQNLQIGTKPPTA